MSDLNKDWHAISAAESLQSLEVDAEVGLSSAEAKKRLELYGSNELQEEPPPTFLERLWGQLRDFVVMILLVSAVVSALMGEWVETIVIMAIVVLNTAIGVIQESKAEEALAALKKMAAPEAHVLRDGHRVAVPARELVPGDIVLLEAGTIIPADLRLITSMNLKMEEASLTGESVPVNKNANEETAADASIGDQHNMAFMSTTVTYGRGTGMVMATGMKTEIGKIAEMIQSVEEEQTPLQNKLDDVGKTLGIASLAVCGLVFVVAVVRPLAFEGAEFEWTLIQEKFMLAVSLAIAAVPEGLPAVVTICLALGMQEMVKRHALMRSLPAVETLGSAMVICSDKTGTLTQNQMTTVRVWADNKAFDISGRGYAPNGDFSYQGDAIDIKDFPTLRNTLWGAVMCNDSEIEAEGSDYRMIGDPTEGAMVVAGAKVGYWREELEKEFPRVNEIPFDSDRKRMTTIHGLEAVQDGVADLCPVKSKADGSGYIAVVKGAPDLVLDCCTHFQTDDGPVEMTTEIKEAIRDANVNMASQALRVLAVAYRELDSLPAEPKPAEVEANLVFTGLEGMIDPARPEVLPAVEKALGAGLRTVMVTGDYPATAAAIAKEIGILRPGHEVVSGKELEAMSDEELDAIVDNVDVFARVTPNHKMRIVAALRDRNNIVAMTGDGVNDAPALKQADIGVAMGITGTDVTKQTADMVLTDDNYVSIVGAIEQGRVIYSNIRKFVYFLLSCNVAEIAILFISELVGWAPPLTVIQLLWLNLLSDGAPALALGLEKGDPDIMDRPPRSPDEPVINKEMMTGIGIQTVAITFAVLVAYRLGVNNYSSYLTPAAQANEFYNDLHVGETMAFITLVLSELFRAYTSRSERYPLWKLGLFSNKWMQYAVGFSVVLLMLVVYLPFEGVHELFSTAPLNLTGWLVMLPLIFLPSIFAEIHKAILSRKDTHS